MDKELKSNLINNGIGLFLKDQDTTSELKMRDIKNKFLEADSVMNSVSKQSEDYDFAKSIKSEGLKQMEAIKPVADALKQQAQEFVKFLPDLSAANDPRKVDIIGAIIGGMIPPMFENGKQKYKVSKKEELTEEALSGMIGGCFSKNAEGHNETLRASQNIIEGMGTGVGGIIPHHRIDQAVETLINTSSNAQDNDPKRLIHEKMSWFKDTLGGLPSMEEWMNSEAAQETFTDMGIDMKQVNFNTILDDLQKGASEGFDMFLKPYLKQTRFMPAIMEKIQSEQPNVPTEDPSSIDNAMKEDQDSGVWEYWDYTYGTGEDTEWRDVPEERKAQIRKEFEDKKAEGGFNEPQLP